MNDWTQDDINKRGVSKMLLCASNDFKSSDDDELITHRIISAGGLKDAFSISMCI